METTAQQNFDSVNYKIEKEAAHAASFSIDIHLDRLLGKCNIVELRNVACSVFALDDSLHLGNQSLAQYLLLGGGGAGLGILIGLGVKGHIVEKTI